MKTGQGFMNYEGVDQAAYREKRLAAFAAALRAMGLAREPVALSGATRSASGFSGRRDTR
jgi:hypothetical protein